MIKVLLGDIFESRMAVLVNTVNCVGIMGKGIAKTFKERYPDNFIHYSELCKVGKVKPGEPYFFESHDLFSERLIINFPTKLHWRSASKIEDVIIGLDHFISHYREWGIKSIAFPPLGCGNGGLEWSTVGRIMYQKLVELDIDVEIYAPYGTSSIQLTTEYLSQPITENQVKLYGKYAGRIKSEWVPIIEAVYILQESPYAPKVGRVIFQKIAYVMTEIGIKSGFIFGPKHYGPYSKELTEAMRVLSNANIISEKQLGSMTQLVINDEYLELRNHNLDIINEYKSKIEKTVDLFSRIKDTEQAEEATTVFFSARKLKLTKSVISEQELVDYILDWKKHWNNENKKKSLISTIRNLVILKWLDVTHSDGLPDQEYI